jgi:hypothetical protein
MPDFETTAASRRWTRRRRRRLRKGDNTSRRIARVLKRCKRGRRCGSAACRVCVRRYRRWICAEMLRVLRRYQPIFHVTLVDERDFLPVRQFANFNPKRMLDKIRQRFTRGLPATAFAVGSIDINFFERTQLFQPHFHLVVGGCTSGDVKSAFAPLYTKTKLVTSPIEIQELKSKAARVRVFSYAMQILPLRVVTTKSRRGIPKTIESELRGETHNAAFSVLGRFHPENLLFLFRMRRRGLRLCQMAAGHACTVAVSEMTRSKLTKTAE